jgi:hypothetical protein
MLWIEISWNLNQPLSMVRNQLFSTRYANRIGNFKLPILLEYQNLKLSLMFHSLVVLPQMHSWWLMVNASTPSLKAQISKGLKTRLWKMAQLLIKDLLLTWRVLKPVEKEVTSRSLLPQHVVILRVISQSQKRLNAHWALHTQDQRHANSTLSRLVSTLENYCHSLVDLCSFLA